MGDFVRDSLPDPVRYFEGEGLSLRGPGTWRTTRCDFHGGSDSMRVNTTTGGWVCMACGEKGGDVLAYAMRMHGLEFVEAARSLGAYVDDGGPHRGQSRSTTLSARDAMEVIAAEVLLSFVVISDIRQGRVPSDADWSRFKLSAARIDALAMEYRP